MSYYRRLIEESEKKRILGMHNTYKSNPRTGLLKEALADFPFCVRNAGTEGALDESPNSKFIRVPNGGGKGKDYLWYIDRTFMVYDTALQKFVKFSDSTQKRKYHCKCVNGKCTAQSYAFAEKDRPDECDEKKACNTQKETTPGGQQGGDCSKGPMDLAVSMGLNWKETKQKWIDAKCNGTTPCILGDATTNINLRNALCKGTWNPKDSGTQTPTGEQPKVGEQPGTEDKKYSEEYITPIFGQTPKAN